jgi:UDP-N-acetylmuramoyl-tripeptide--D-alanyl-D-alanine ligase
MRYQARDLLWLAGSSLGRRQLQAHLYSRSQPLLEAAAGLHRRTFARGCRLVAVVGSFGKTTTTAALAAALETPILRAQGKGMGRIAAAVLEIRPSQKRAILEIGIDRKGQMARHGAVARPDVVVVTAIGSEHSGSLGSLDQTRDEKAIILRHVRNGGIVVLNGDDPRVGAMATSTPARVLTFGFGADNDVRASGLHLDWPHGTRFDIHV